MVPNDSNILTDMPRQTMKTWQCSPLFVILFVFQVILSGQTSGLLFKCENNYKISKIIILKAQGVPGSAKCHEVFHVVFRFLLLVFRCKL